MIKFCKFHGFGNDYIVIEREAIPAAVSLGDLAKAICHRNTGVGADGIAVLVRTGSGSDRVPESKNNHDADYFCEIVNPDGSTAGFSGNGTRCAVSYLYYKGLWTAENLRLETRSGLKNYRFLDRIGDAGFEFEAEIGKPKFASDEIPVALEKPTDTVIDQQLTQLTFSAVNVGNPVVCIFVDDFVLDWRELGRTLETHSAFPERANIVFVKIIDRENIEIRIWERGAGETAASGTCSSGAAVLSAFMLKTERKVSVHSEGGTTRVLWRDDDEIVLTGRADLAFCGEWP